jgi:putative peptide zinc metalloprotease protein
MSTESLSRTQLAWQALQKRKLKVSPALKFYCHRYRKVPWFIICDETSGKYFRCTRETYLFLKLLNGKHDVATVYRVLSKQLQSNTPDCTDLLDILARLQGADLLLGWGEAELSERFSRDQQQKQAQRLQRWLRPLVMKIPLWDPDAFLHRYSTWVNGIFTPFGFFVWCVLVLLAALQGVGHWNALELHWQTRFMDAGNLALLLVLYPLVKCIHELGHGFATRRWGGEVHEMGIMLLVLMPLPYVDASSSHCFYHKRERMVVAAAGIMVELFIASIAMVFWLQLESGLAKDICFNLMVVCGVSTVLFNGNPLLRFDGYYLLMDAIEIPNLGSRSNQFFNYLFRRYVLRVQAAPSPVTADGEKIWFVLYGIASNLYRIYISIVIALFVASKYFVLGIILAVWAFVGQIIWPSLKGLIGHFVFAKQAGQQSRYLVFVGVALSLCAVLLFGIPFTYSVSAQGVVMLSGDAQVRAPTEGFQKNVLARSGDYVEPGQLVIQLENAELYSSRKLLLAQIDEIEIKRNQVMISDQAQSNIYLGSLQSKRAQLSELNKEIQSLQIVSAKSGVIFMNNEADWQGRWVDKGEVLAYVIDPDAVQATVVVAQQDIESVTENMARMEVRFHSAPDRVFSARLLNQVPMATNQLPSSVLGSQHGGAVLVDARDPEGVATIGNVFELNIEIGEWPDLTYLGARLNVRFIQSRQVLGLYVYRRMQQYLSQQY